jgi:hypothetical protein
MARRSRIRGVNNVRRGLSRFFNQEVNRRAERAITELLIIGMAKAAVYTPIDKGLLINSSFREVRVVGGKTIGIAGYTQNYAQALHDREGWQGRLNPNAGPKFLERGFEETQSLQNATFRRIMRT